MSQWVERSAQVNISSKYGDEQDDEEPGEEPSVLDQEEHWTCLEALLLLLSDGIHLGELRQKLNIDYDSGTEFQVCRALKKRKVILSEQ